MKLSVVIVSYNVKSYLEQCLCSLEKSLRNIDNEILFFEPKEKFENIFRETLNLKNIKTESKWF